MPNESDSQVSEHHASLRGVGLPDTVALRTPDSPGALGVPLAGVRITPSEHQYSPVLCDTTTVAIAQARGSDRQNRV